MPKNKTITEEKLKHYFEITEEALKKAQETPENLELEGAREDFLDMVSRYLEDAKHFYKNGEIVNAFAALNYAHGWLDAGARIGLWDVKDSRLFTAD